MLPYKKADQIDRIIQTVFPEKMHDEIHGQVQFAIYPPCCQSKSSCQPFMRRLLQAFIILLPPILLPGLKQQCYEQHGQTNRHPHRHRRILQIAGVFPPKQPQEEEQHSGEIEQEPVRKHPRETSPLARVDAPELLSGAVVHVEGVFALGQEGEGVFGGVLDGGRVAELFAVVQVPALAVVAGFVEAVAELLVGDGAPWWGGVDGAGEEIVACV